MRLGRLRLTSAGGRRAETGLQIDSAPGFPVFVAGLGWRVMQGAMPGFVEGFFGLGLVQAPLVMSRRAAEAVIFRRQPGTLGALAFSWSFWSSNNPRTRFLRVAMAWAALRPEIWLASSPRVTSRR